MGRGRLGFAAALLLGAACGSGESSAQSTAAVTFTQSPLTPAESLQFDDVPKGGVVASLQAVLLSSQPGQARVALRYGGGSCDPTLGDGTAEGDAYLEGEQLIVVLHPAPPPKPGYSCTNPGLQTALDFRLPEGHTASSVTVRSPAD